MLKRIGILLSAALFILPYPHVSTAYVIQLKNGVEFSTYHYWQEGNQTMFYLEGGIVGIEKDFIKEIRKSHPVKKRVIHVVSEITRTQVSEQGSSVPSANQGALGNKDLGNVEQKPEGESTAENISPVDFVSYQQKNLALRTALEKALERYRMASGQQDKEAEEKAREEFRALSKQLFDLSDEVKAKNNGVLPAWWEKL